MTFTQQLWAVYSQGFHVVYPYWGNGEMPGSWQNVNSKGGLPLP